VSESATGSRTIIGRCPWLLLVPATAAVLILLAVQARDPRWAHHLQSDGIRYARYGAAFIEGGSWTALPSTEWQPGAMWFFVLPFAFVSPGLSYGVVFVGLNAALLALHLPLLWRLGGRRAAWSALLLFMAAGPIVYFRFELLVSLLVLVALAAVPSGRPALSGVALGLATMTKVYPLFLAPLFLRAFWTGRNPVPIRRFAAGFLAGTAGPLIAFIAWGGTLGGFVESLRYHAAKPVAVHSLVGAILTAIGTAVQAVPAPIHAYGMYGLRAPAGLTSLMTLLALAAILLVYRSWWRHAEEADRDSHFFVATAAVVLSLVVLPTGLQPQYLIWPLALVALVPIGALPSRIGPWALTLAAISLLAMQAPFPVYFDDFLALYQQGHLALLPHLALVVSLAAITTLFGALLWAAVAVEAKPLSRTSLSRRHHGSSAPPRRDKHRRAGHAFPRAALGARRRGP
jgi:glycosyl transferase family 87